MGIQIAVGVLKDLHIDGTHLSFDAGALSEYDLTVHELVLDLND